MEIDSHNEGNFDEVREKVQVVLDKTDIDDKIVDGVEKIKKTFDDKPKKEKKPVKKKTTKKTDTKKGDK